MPPRLRRQPPPPTELRSAREPRGLASHPIPGGIVSVSCSSFSAAAQRRSDPDSAPSVQTLQDECKEKNRKSPLRQAHLGEATCLRTPLQVSNPLVLPHSWSRGPSPCPLPQERKPFSPSAFLPIAAAWAAYTAQLCHLLLEKRHSSSLSWASGD